MLLNRNFSFLSVMTCYDRGVNNDDNITMVVIKMVMTITTMKTLMMTVMTMIKSVMTMVM